MRDAEEPFVFRNDDGTFVMLGDEPKRCRSCVASNFIVAAIALALAVVWKIWG